MKEQAIQRLYSEIRAEFPRLNRVYAKRIAQHRFACDKPVNSSKGKGFGSRVANIVAAHIRHQLTAYDSLFSSGYTKEQARRQVQDQVSHYLQAWR